MEKLRADLVRGEAEESRREIAKAIQIRAYDQLICVPLGQFRAPAAWRTTLTGIVKSPIPVFWNVEQKS